MNKFQLIALLSLIIYSYEVCSKAGTSASQVKKDDCKDDNLDQTLEKDYGYEHCCFATDDYRLKNGACIALTKPQYENIKDLIKHKELEDGAINGKIDCNSLYLKIGLLSLIFFLL